MKYSDVLALNSVKKGSCGVVKARSHNGLTYSMSTCKYFKDINVEDGVKKKVNWKPLLGV